MPTFCLTKSTIEKLKKGVQSGDITIEKLKTLSAQEANDLIAKYVGDMKVAQEINALFERAFLKDTQQAIKNVVWKTFYGGKPLYTDITLAQSQKMGEALKMSDLKGLTSEERIKKLSEFVPQKSAEKLEKRYQALEKSGNLKNWEERTLGTKELFENEKLKGNLAKLDALKDMGALTPKDTEKFMENFVESKLGVEVTREEAKQIASLSETASKAFDEIAKTNDWTANNANNVYAYFKARSDLEKYQHSLEVKNSIDTANALVEITRNNILGSPRIARNSVMYQIIPSGEREITKRLVSANIGDIDASFMEKLAVKISDGLGMGKQGRNFAKRQWLMSMKIYKDTGYDISRMMTLREGRTYIGETEKRIDPKSLIERYAKATSFFPKWFAGGSDTVIANATRVETSVLWAKEIAALEAKKGKLPAGMTKEQRAEQLLVESYSFNPKDHKAQKIREMAILDAHSANSTQPDSMADWVVGLRDKIGFGGFKFGKALVPFAKIPATAISRGFQTAIPINVLKDIRTLQTAVKVTDEGQRAKILTKSIASLVSTLGLVGTTVLIATLLDDDDYIPPYRLIKGKEYQLARARGANSGSVRINGKWIPLKYLPIISIPLSAIMEAKRAKARNQNPAIGYVKGIVAQFFDMPLIGDVDKLYTQADRAFTAKATQDVISGAGFDSETVWNWAKVRAIPSVLSWDLYNYIFPPESKYDFLGREIERGGGFKDDKSNEIIIEFNNLGKENETPTISDPSGKTAEEAKEKLGEEAYIEKLNSLKQKYAEKVLQEIRKDSYKRKSAEDKKKEIDELRRKYILDKL